MHLENCLNLTFKNTKEHCLLFAFTHSCNISKYWYWGIWSKYCDIWFCPYPAQEEGAEIRWSSYYLFSYLLFSDVVDIKLNVLCYMYHSIANICFLLPCRDYVLFFISMSLCSFPCKEHRLNLESTWIQFKSLISQRLSPPPLSLPPYVS